VFIEALDGITSNVSSDHIMNLLEDVSGKLPEDKPAMLKVIDSYQQLPERDRIIYRIGRRSGIYRSIEDFRRDSDTHQKISQLIQEIEDFEGAPGVERYICEMVDRYI